MSIQIPSSYHSRVLYGAVNTVPYIDNQDLVFATTPITISHGVWIVRLQMNGFTNTGGKWIGIKDDGANVHCMQILTGVQGGTVVAIIDATTWEKYTVYGFIINYGGANSYTPHYSDSFLAVRVG